MNFRTLLVALMLITAVPTLASSYDRYTHGRYTHNRYANNNNTQGRYIMVGSRCAGFSFNADNTVNWYDESQCQSPTKMRLKKVSPHVFAFIQLVPSDANRRCAPRVFLYRVISKEKGNLVLKEMWTGWGNLKDETIRYRWVRSR